jgi:hypothetical protein
MFKNYIQTAASINHFDCNRKNLKKFKWKSDMEMNVVAKILAFMLTGFFLLFFYIDK